MLRGPRAGKSTRHQLLERARSRTRAAIDQLVARRRSSVSRRSIEVGGIGARAGERELLAGAAIERRDARAPDILRGVRRSSRRLPPSTRRAALRARPTRPRRAASNCSGVISCAPAPIARRRARARVTSGPRRPASPETAAASAASSSSRSRGQPRRARRERDDRGLILGASGRAGTIAGTSRRARPRMTLRGSCTHQRAGRDVAEPLAVAPQQHRVTIAKRVARTAGNRPRAAGCASSTRPA